MDLIYNNPFRILGVTANASLSDRKQQANLIAQYLKIGKSAKLEFDLSPPLKSIERTKELIDLQGSRIHSTEDKIIYSLFWFVQANSIDKIALKHLTKSRDIQAALSDFEKGCRDFIVNPNNYSSILNYSTLEIIDFNENQNITKLKQAISNKFRIISDPESLLLLKDLVAKDGTVPNVSNILELALPKLKNLLIDLVPNENIDRLLLEIFESNEAIYPGLKREIVDELVDNINLLVNKTEKERERLLEQEFSLSLLKTLPSLAKKLISDTKVHLKNLKSLEGKSTSVYTDMIQKIFEEVNYCGVLPFNKWIEKLNNSNSNRSDLATLKREANLTHILSLYKLALLEIKDFDIPIKQTITNNYKGISEIELEEKCGFCNINDASEYKKIRVPMYKFTDYLQSRYTYFKDGGFPISCCSTCQNKIVSRKLFSYLVSLSVYGTLAVITGGISVGIDAIFVRFGIIKWWIFWVKKQLFYSQVENHVTIKKMTREGYKFGKPLKF